MPTTEMESAVFEKCIGILNLLTNLELTKSNGEARRLVQQNGVKLNGEAVADFKKEVTLDDFKDGEIIIQKGKKVFQKVKIK